MKSESTMTHMGAFKSGPNLSGYLRHSVPNLCGRLSVISDQKSSMNGIRVLRYRIHSWSCKKNKTCYVMSALGQSAKSRAPNCKKNNSAEI